MVEAVERYGNGGGGAGQDLEPVQSRQDASVQVASQRELAEVQGMIVLAKKFPRDEKRAMDKILNACSRPGMAEVAVYE